jgi:hypothetical protein
MPLIGAEAVAASALIFFASTIIAAYLMDAVGFTIRPFAVLALAAGAAGGTLFYLWPRSVPDRPVLIAFGASICGLFAWLLWLARPDFLPTGSGPDLAHHLALFAYIERHWRLVHDVGLSDYLGEMVDYTPGMHLLAVLTGAWLRTDGLHAVYAVIAASVALKTGFVFLIAVRLLPRDVPRIPFALIAVAVLFLPYVYFVGSFTEQSYLAQVLAELFAVAMWWAVLVWDDRPSIGPMALYAASGVAAFLTWPVWTGPLLLLLGLVALLRGNRPATPPAPPATPAPPALRLRLLHLAIAAIPIAAAAAIHAFRHAGGFRMAGTGGFAIWPSVHVLGWWFIALAAAGLMFCVTERRARGVILLVIAIAAQATGLVATAQASGAAAPYLALKMFYLAIYPMSVAIALTLAAAWRVIVRAPGTWTTRLAWILAVLIAIGVARPTTMAALARPRPVVTQPVVLAAQWTRGRLSPGCIDYLVSDTYTAYWLHLAVFGNPRTSGRAMDDDTFEPKKAIVRWILPDSLSYAITDNLEALPRDVQGNVEVLARFGPAAVVKRRGPSRCPDG